MVREDAGMCAWRRNMACARAHFEELRELGELHHARGAARVCDMRALNYESHSFRLVGTPPTTN